MPYKYPTTIGLSRQTKELLEGLKEDGESWDDLLETMYNRIVSGQKFSAQDSQSVDSETELVGRADDSV